MSLTLTINGEARSYDGDLRAPLAEVLRETFGLIGTKPVCGEGFCGACTVLVDGEAVHACLRPVGLLIGRRIVTIEGMSSPAELNRIQEALAEHAKRPLSKHLDAFVARVDIWGEGRKPFRGDDAQVGGPHVV